MESPAKEEEIKKMIDLQKKEIQASNDAYILENMAVQLKSQAKEELVQSYDVTIKQISLSVDEPFEEIQNSLQGIEVTLEAEEAGSEAVETIQPVVLGAADTAETEKENQIRRASEIKTYLASIWEVDPEKISLKMEGGEGSTDE
jgi:stage III sporulation protein AF